MQGWASCSCGATRSRQTWTQPGRCWQSPSRLSCAGTLAPLPGRRMPQDAQHVLHLSGVGRPGRGLVGAGRAHPDRHAQARWPRCLAVARPSMHSMCCTYQVSADPDAARCRQSPCRPSCGGTLAPLPGCLVSVHSMTCSCRATQPLQMDGSWEVLAGPRGLSARPCQGQLQRCCCPVAAARAKRADHPARQRVQHARPTSTLRRSLAGLLAWLSVQPAQHQLCELLA